MKQYFLFAICFLCLTCLFFTLGCEKKTTFLNVSYDPTRELYKDFNSEFAEHWKSVSGESMEFKHSNGGSGSQARKVINGLEADVVTLALSYDIDHIGIESAARGEKFRLLAPDWQKKFPNNSCPYTSTIVFLVRKGNPKGIHDWDDLLKPDVRIITPDPKTSGGARWNYLAAWGYILNREMGDLFPNAGETPAVREAADAKAFEFVKALFHRDKIPVMDSGARQSTNTFVQHKRGDVLLAWENEALYFLTSDAGKNVEIVVPSISILAEPPVAIVDANVDKKGTRKIAEAYLQYLYDEKGQEMCAKHFYRPSNKEVEAKYRDRFTELKLFTIDDVFGGWENAQKVHFSDGGTFERIGKQ